MGSKIVIYGGGTINHIRSHLALCAPSFGATAIHLSSLDYGKATPILKLTKMASQGSSMITNLDLQEDLNKVLLDWDVKCIIMSAAICDFDAQVGNIPSGAHAARLSSSTTCNIVGTPSDKLIATIKQERPDIILVGFKTTTNATEGEQVVAAAKQDSDIILCNDTVTRQNILVWGGKATAYPSREDTLTALHNLIKDKLHYHHYRDLSFKGKTIRNANFQNAMLRGSSFEGATLVNCNFMGAQLQRANFIDAVLDGCTFNGADMRGVISNASLY